ncbi:hypothetical protein [Nocardia wallacei]|uniref:hypothetical protein n=1 Tax=Nocardia wallacei TaxID=480035 RepID=UPI0024553F0F|nr:hypothetical protein [Nocardia wallacei]
MDTEAETLLADLDRRVTEKYAAAWDAAHPEWVELREKWAEEFGPFELAAEPAKPLPPEWQFPPVRWVIYPHRRMYCLVLADNAIDHGHLAEAGILIQFGGRERIS